MTSTRSLSSLPLVLLYSAAVAHVWRRRAFFGGVWGVHLHGGGLGLPGSSPTLVTVLSPAAPCSSLWSSFEAVIFIFFCFLSRVLYCFSGGGGRSDSSACLSQKQDRE